MPVIRYTMGFNENVREISSADWKAVGVTDQGMVRWNKENNWTAEVSGAAAKHVLENEQYFEADASAEVTSEK